MKLRLGHVLKRMNTGMLRDYIRVGSPVFLSGAIWGLAMAIQTGILGHMGSSAIPANSVATTVFQIITVFIYASASAAAGLLRGRLAKRSSPNCAWMAFSHALSSKRFSPRSTAQDSLSRRYSTSSPLS